MATINYTAPDGSQHQIPLPEGADAAQTVAQFETAQGFTAIEQPTGSRVTEPERQRMLSELSTGTDKAKRGIGLGLRSVAGAIPKIGTGLADLAAATINLPIAGLDKAGQFLGDEPLTARLPTNATASLDELLDKIFPSPETFGEKVVVGGGEIALTGGAGGAALASRAAKFRVGEGIETISKTVPSLADEIGLMFAKTPGKFGVLEATGGGGAVAASELAEEADAGPLAKTLATLVGGVAGTVAPTVAVSASRRAATGAMNVVDAARRGENRAAIELQKRAADPEAAAIAARDAPEGVLPGRATEEPGLRAVEQRALADDPAAELAAIEGLEAAETRTLTEIADQFGPTSNKADFQQSVIERAAAPGTKIKPGQPDEMLNDAALSFDKAYKAAEGFEIRTQDFTEPSITPLRTTLERGTTDSRIIAGNKSRRRISIFLTDLLDDVSRRGPRAAGPDDAPITRLQSEDLLEMRQIIRQEVRARAKPTASTKAKAEGKMLQNANDAITSTLESQLPADAAKALRATDARYADFITVQGALLRSGEKGLTPEALRASVKVRASSQGDVARGKTGELGRLAETGKDVAATLAKGGRPGDAQQAARIVRNMTPEQLQVAKADFNKAVADRATSPTTGKLDGKKYLAQIDKNREVLKAAGLTDNEIANMEKIGKALRMMQSRSPAATTQLLEDNAGIILNLVARIAGSKAGTRALKLFGAAGAGPSLILAQFGSKTMQTALRGLSIDQAELVMRKAALDKELMAAMLIRPNDSLKRQADAARVINAFVFKVGQQAGDKAEEK